MLCNLNAQLQTHLDDTRLSHATFQRPTLTDRPVMFCVDFFVTLTCRFTPVLSIPIPWPLTAFPGCERSPHGFSIQRQHVFADVQLQPQRRLLSAIRVRRWREGVQWHHLAVDRRAGNHRQHCGGGRGLCLCLLTRWNKNTFSDKMANLVFRSDEK